MSENKNVSMSSCTSVASPTSRQIVVRATIEGPNNGVDSVGRRENMTSNPKSWSSPDLSLTKQVGHDDLSAEEAQRMALEKFEDLKVHMRSVADMFRDRTVRHKLSTTRPISPTMEDLKVLDEEVEQLRNEKKLVVEDFSEENPYRGMGHCQRLFRTYILPDAIHPQSKFMLFTLGLQTLAFLYNAWVIPLRCSFHIYQHPGNQMTWLVWDCAADILYLMDTLVFKTRVMYLDECGMYESKRSGTIRNFIRAGTFKRDALSLVPLDLFYIITGFRGRAAVLRFPRLLRGYNFGIFFDRLDAFLPYPVFVRLTRTVNIMMFLIHINACLFYAFSDFEGINSSSFVFDGHGNAYIRCFYIGLKTSVSIGINPKPEKDRPIQMVFMGSLWLMGVFVFAVLIGNVKDIIAQASHNKDEYMAKFDQVSQYMYEMGVPQQTVRRVKVWCEYTWETQKTFDELTLLSTLPKKIRTDVALDIHYETINNVKLFHGCDPGLIKELVIKLQPIIFLSGDYIVKKGDVGKEMFIITVGQAQVVGGPEDSMVFVTLGKGVAFGEIALLGSDGMNRRTANVRALGFTTLYVLYKEDLNEALNDFPEDRALLARKAKKAAKEIAAKQSAEKSKETVQIAKTRQDVIFKDDMYEPVMALAVKKMLRSGDGHNRRSQEKHNKDVTASDNEKVEPMESATPARKHDEASVVMETENISAS